MSLGPVAQQIWLDSSRLHISLPYRCVFSAFLPTLSPAMEHIDDAFALIRACSRIVPTRGATGSHAHARSIERRLSARDWRRAAARLDAPGRDAAMLLLQDNRDASGSRYWLVGRSAPSPVGSA